MAEGAGPGPAAALAGIAVFLLVAGWAGRAGRRTTRRLERLARPVPAAAEPPGDAGGMPGPRPWRTARAAAAAIGRWGELRPGHRAAREAAEVRRLLRRAGWEAALTPEEMRGVQVVLAAAGALLGWWRTPAGPNPVAAGAVAAALGLAGWLLLPAAAARAAAARQARLARALPDVLDLLWLCTRGGLTLLQALEVVSQVSRSPLRDELARTAQEARVAGALPDALRSLAARLDVPAVTRLAAALVRGAELGVPVGETLAQQARSARLALRQAAEARLAGLPARLAVVGMVCFLPLVFVLVLLPQFLAFFGSGW